MRTVTLDEQPAMAGGADAANLDPAGDAGSVVPVVVPDTQGGSAATPDPVEAPRHVDMAAVDDDPLALLTLDGDRSPDASVCPFLRRVNPDGELVAPGDVPSDQHLCVAVGEPRPQSLRQQELLCLRLAHADCPRYLRGGAAPTEPTPAPSAVRIPRATVAALVILVLSAGISFGFVIQRGGLQMPVASPASPSSSAVAVVASPTLAPTTPAPATESPATPEPTEAPSPSQAPSPTPAPTPPPTPVPTPVPTPAPTVAPTATPAATSDRYAVLVPCPDRDGCWIYTVRAGDNLVSIANWFGIKLSVIYEWNPVYKTQGIRKGDEIRMPPPTR